MSTEQPKKSTKNQFKKGNTASKGYGRPKLTEAQKMLQIKTRAQFKEMIDKYMICDIKVLNKLLKRKDIPVIDAMIIKSLHNALSSGDQSQINWFMNHSLGKPKEETNINLKGSMTNTNEIDLSKLSKEQLLALQDIALSQQKKKEN